MYKISEDRSLQVSRRVYDSSQQVVVFHVCVISDDLVESTDYIELRNGACRFLTLVDGVLEVSGSVVGTGYTDAMAAFSSEPTDSEAENYLLVIGTLPAVWEEEIS